MQSCSLFSFVYLLPACECRRGEKQSLGGFSRASSQGIFQFLFHSQNDKWLCHFLPSHCRLGAVTPVSGLRVWFSSEYWRFSSIRDLCLGCPGMEVLQDGAPWGAGHFQISVLLLWALPWDKRAAWAKAFDRILWIGTVLGVPALWSSVLQVLGARMRRGLDGREGVPTLAWSSQAAPFY